MIKLIGLVPLFPLIGFLINGFFGKKLGRGLSGMIACGSILASFILSVLIFIELNGSQQKSNIVCLFSWINSDTLRIPFELLVDPLSALFLLIITGIGFLIHVYSVGYMHDDAGFSRFFTYLNLFVFFMLLLVLGNNYLIMFVGWEGVGLCSYLLIGFWFKNTAYNDAARKAFVMNRIGDLGFLLGIILIFMTFGSTSYNEVFTRTADTGTVTCIALLLFVGAMGKSAQIPLYTWLPDAMAGPTPVSALIHAATMVTAGIYMVARSNVFYSISHVASEVVAITGVATALFAATIGLFQNDIKKILAYSTVSQLGLMFLGLGVGAYSSAVFHVTTHAFFKALLFLGAGSVIHAMGGEQDIRRMGGLKDKIKITFITMLIGTIAISGIPPFSGFFSKDEILAHAYEHDGTHLLWFFGVITSMLTAFYMFRLMFLTFWGSFRGTHAQEHHLHESPPSMTVPLIVLAALSVLGGALGLPEFWGMPNWMHHNLDSVIMRPNPSILDHDTEWILMGLAVASAAAVILIAYNFYIKNKALPAESEAEMKGWQRLIYHKYYVDEFYDAAITKPLNAVAKFLHKFVDLQVIDGIVNGTGKLVQALGSLIRMLQTGNISFYLVGMVIGAACILLFTFIIK